MSLVSKLQRELGNFCKSSAIRCVALLPLALGAAAYAESGQPAAQAPAAVHVMQPSTESAKYPLPAGGVTLERLNEILTDVGYEPEQIDNNLGGVFFRIHANGAKWKFTLNVSQSVDKKYLWISSALADIPDASKASPAALVKVLAKNHAMAPAFFDFREDNRLYYALPVANHDVKAATIRTAIETVLTDIQDSNDLWDVATLNGGTTATATATKP